MTKQFMMPPARMGYGSRIWVETPEVDNPLYKGSELYKKLAKLSMWGGHDKSGQNFNAFEFSTLEGKDHTQAVKVLEDAGYVNNQDFYPIV